MGRAAGGAAHLPRCGRSRGSDLATRGGAPRAGARALPGRVRWRKQRGSKSAGIAFEGAPYHQDFVQADVEINWQEPLSSDVVRVALPRRGLLLVIPSHEPASCRIIASGAKMVSGEERDTRARGRGTSPFVSCSNSSTNSRRSRAR